MPWPPIPCLLLASPPALPFRGEAPFQPVDPGHLDTFRRELTLRLIHRLEDPAFSRLLARRLEQEPRRLPLLPLLQDCARLWPAPEHLGFAEEVRRLDQDLRRLKGLEAHDRGLLALEVVWPRQGPRRLDWDTALFAVAPGAPKRAVVQLEAYDRKGRPQWLDARTPPSVPVILAGVDRGEAKRAAITLLNAGLAKAHLAPLPPPAQGPIPCARLTFIRLRDDQEPWWKGAAEVYAFSAGVDPLEPKPAIKVLDLPYLTHDQTDYFPGQLILFWPDWRFGAADFQLWEADDSTNYQEVLGAILGAVSSAVALGGAPAFSWIPALAQAILQAMPSSWYKDNDDHLDTFYTLEQDRTYTRHSGAAGNALLSLEPFLLRPRTGGPEGPLTLSRIPGLPGRPALPGCPALPGGSPEGLRTATVPGPP